ncbi:protein of unknown function [Modestobacter italicus]|uniref:Uncharacterized protein n=1 Tax=Modestobacter italicus (strain DSM 44449 / CECT 9708 / BC 501) TaxID=2732864 RepID=I4F0M2_MODI5|nr:protein of unknown function [Modestobacter marinus]
MHQAGLFGLGAGEIEHLVFASGEPSHTSDVRKEDGWYWPTHGPQLVGCHFVAPCHRIVPARGAHPDDGMGSEVTELSPAQRASRGHQLACAFLLAYTRGDQDTLIPVLEDAQSEIVDFCVSLAHAGTRLAREAIGEEAPRDCSPRTPVLVATTPPMVTTLKTLVFTDLFPHHVRTGRWAAGAAVEAMEEVIGFSKNSCHAVSALSGRKRKST